MAMKPLRPCRHPGCCVLVSGGYCVAHEPPKEDRRSEASKAWRWMYSTSTWKQLRGRQLLEEPFCRECARRGQRSKATDVDHIQDHKGSWNLFTDPENLESLCHSCHSRKTMREQQEFKAKKQRH